MATFTINEFKPFINLTHELALIENNLRNRNDEPFFPIDLLYEFFDL